MSAITLDTLRLAQKLRDNAKFSAEQAEQTAIALSESLTGWLEAQQLATKGDITEIRNELATRLAETEARLVKWVVGVGFAQVAMLLAFMKIH